MATTKTAPTGKSVTQYLNAIGDPDRRADARKLAKLMRGVTGRRPKMWGSSIVGYGSYRYQRPSGGEAQWPLTGFSARSQSFSIYIMPGFSRYASLLERLGKHKTGKSCLYVKRLEDIDMDVLQELVERSVRDMRETYG